MTTFKSFEDIEAWQKARLLAKLVYQETQKEPLKFDFALRDQVRRSVGSIMDNIAEGFDRGGNKEFIQFLSISKASAAELKSQLYRALDVNYINEAKFNELTNYIDDIGKMIAGLIGYLQNTEIKGIKYKTQNRKQETKN